MSKKMPTVWEAAPHTIAKITLLGSYLYVWFSMLGRSFSKDLWYIDGFAGPGEYTNFANSSPLASIKAAQTAIAGQQWRAGQIFCALFEDDKARFSNLQAVLDSAPRTQKINVLLHQGSFEEGVAWLKQQRPNPFQQNAPLFTFIDPFGTKGLPFSVVADLLSRPACEVLVNLDSDGIGRVLKAGTHANHEVNLTSLFGSEQWKERLDPKLGITELSRKAVALYIERLRSLPKVKFVFPFEMTTKSSVINYHLVFASQHPKGLEKMKEAMKKIDQSGEYSFCDAHVSQQNLFRLDNLPIYAKAMLQKFAGATVGIEEAYWFALNETPFTNAKAMLKQLEADGKIAIHAPASRRKGTFPDEMPIRITFQA